MEIFKEMLLDELVDFIKNNTDQEKKLLAIDEFQKINNKTETFLELWLFISQHSFGLAEQKMRQEFFNSTELLTTSNLLFVAQNFRGVIAERAGKKLLTFDLNAFELTLLLCYTNNVETREKALKRLFLSDADKDNYSIVLSDINDETTINKISAKLLTKKPNSKELCLILSKATDVNVLEKANERFFLTPKNDVLLVELLQKCAHQPTIDEAAKCLFETETTLENVKYVELLNSLFNNYRVSSPIRLKTLKKIAELHGFNYDEVFSERLFELIKNFTNYTVGILENDED